MKTIAIHGGKGNHAQDIIGRKVLEGFHIQIIDIGDSLPQDVDAHLLFLPIQETRRKIEELCNLSPGTPIINFSGIQQTSPEKLVENGTVTNIHFLFGPNMQGDELKASIETTQVNGIVSQVLEKVEKLGIKVLRHNSQEHDQKVALTQGLVHILFLVFQKLKVLPPTLFERWKAVPPNTSGGMICLNPFVQKYISLLIQKIQGGKTIQQALRELVESGEVGDFTTPNFERIYRTIIALPEGEVDIFGPLLREKQDDFIHHLQSIMPLSQNEIVNMIQQEQSKK